MSVKLARYIFRRIGGRIVPIRNTLVMASDDISRAAAKVKELGKYRHKIEGLKKLGRGVDFDVFSLGDKVLKLPSKNPSRAITSKKLLDLVPNINDKVARSQALAENLPNFGIPTVESASARISRGLKALVQPFQKIGGRTQAQQITFREANQLSFKTGLGLDAHTNNLTHGGAMVDTALGKLPTFKSLTQPIAQKMMGGVPTGKFSDPAMAKELLTGGYWGKGPKHFKAADVMTERAAVEGASKKALSKLNEAIKKGFRLKQTKAGQFGSYDEFKLVSPTERIAAAKERGISFVKQNGKIVPRRGK